MPLKIISATIGPMPRKMPLGLLDPLPDVTVKFSDNTEKKLFSFYPDEISFTPDELIGLTEEETFKLKTQKDKTYLQSQS